jgi:DNA-binding XRE family transcriptional regulator
MSIEIKLNEIGEEYNELLQELARKQDVASAQPIEKFAELIKEARKSQKLTMHTLCELSGISYSTLSKIESGNCAVQFKMVAKVAETLGLKIWIG